MQECPFVSGGVEDPETTLLLDGGHCGAAAAGEEVQVVVEDGRCRADAWRGGGG
jgi:hypothetical protein